MQRNEFIGGSDVAAVMNISPTKTRRGLWAEKTGRAVRAITPEQQKRFDRGHKLEPYVVDMVVERLRDEGHDVELIARNRRYRDPLLPYLSAEIDFELRIDGAPIDNGDIKTVNQFGAKRWGADESDDVPIEYAAQFMHGLGITGRKRCIVGALIGLDNLSLFRIERDDATIAGMRNQCRDFWENYVLADREPEPVNLDDCRAMFPRTDNARRIQATSEIERDVFDLASVKAKIKALETIEEGLQYNITRYMRNNAFLSNSRVDLATWKEQTAMRLDEGLLKKEQTALFEQYCRPRVTRVLRLKV
ncbi:putative phage-type endonuclease [Paraburkholderia youngii]|uniref:YqaJ viral recombinase family nuclease n=1 Tax=Paraburkholderia youngii TaxID=2782701 RepID=UPI003D226726